MTVDFDKINRAALPVLPVLLKRWLPGGHREGQEWVVLNPRRRDLHHGSFKINMVTGRWADFALADAKGRDVIGLAAYIFDLPRVDAARKLAKMLGVA